MKQLIGFMVILAMFNSTSSGNIILPLLEATAIQDEGTSNIDVRSDIETLDGNWSPKTIGTVTIDYYASGGSSMYFDAINLTFDAQGADLSSMALMIYIQKGDYSNLAWEHYQLLPGLNNPTNQDASPTGGGVSGIRDVNPSDETQLSAGTTWGWINIPFDATSDPDYLVNGDIALTLRLWNLRVVKVQLTTHLPEPATLGLFIIGGLALLRRRRM